MIRFTKVSKQYPRGGPALEEVSFSLRRGEFAFLTGPSGAGKSTILKLVYVAERPSDGEVRIDGKSSVTLSRREIPRLRRRLGVVFQDFRLLEDRTAEQNVAFALEVTGTPQSQIGAKVARALTQVGLASKSTALPHELSGGEQQRVAIARAVANAPRVLLADEPTGNLDSTTSDTVFRQLLALARETGMAALIATHNPELAARMDRTVVLKDGVLSA